MKKNIVRLKLEHFPTKIKFAPKDLKMPHSKTQKYLEEGVGIRTFLSETVSADPSINASQGDTWSEFDWGKRFTGSPT